MKPTVRNTIAAVVVLVLAFGAFVARHYEPRRPRPEGWNAPWNGLPLETETVWSLQRTRREVIQQLFFQSTSDLAHCNAEYFRGKDSVATSLELLTEVDGGAARFVFVTGEPRAELPPGLVPCVERALEKVRPVRHPDLGQQSVRWRLGLSFLFHPPAELPEAHWWDGLVPDSWRSGGSSPIHVG